MSTQTSTNAKDSTQSDGYDPNLIPAETAARIKREGDSYKDAPAGSTVDTEGLANNYAVEPEMYYEERGDLREKEEQLKAERAQELAEINQTSEKGKLESGNDERGKGVGAI